jgi:ketosteroid isomerase-like protein
MLHNAGYEQLEWQIRLFERPVSRKRGTVMKTVMIVLCFAAITIALAQAPQKPASTSEAAVRDADDAFSKSFASKSVEQIVSFYDEEAMTAGSAMPSAQGIEALREMYKKMLSQPGFTLTWKLDKVVIAKSGTIAYSSGAWRMAGPTGPYLIVWRKQPDSQWKVLIDAAWLAQSPK